MVNLLVIPNPSRLRLENFEFTASLSKHSKNELVSNTEIGQRTGAISEVECLSGTWKAGLIPSTTKQTKTPEILT